MVGISEVNSLAARRKALVEESEIYRRTLELELQNARLYAARVRQRFQLLRAAKPLLFLLPLVGSWLRPRVKAEPAKPSRGWRRVVSGLLLGWRMYRSAAPFLPTFAARRRPGAAPPDADPVGDGASSKRI